MGIFRRKIQEVPVDPISREARDELSRRLAGIHEELVELDAGLGASFQEKVEGVKHDLEYGVDADFITERIQALEKERAVVMIRIDRINVGLAHTALGSPSDKE